MPCMARQTLKHCAAGEALRTAAFSCDLHLAMERATAPHSSALAWRLPGTGEPGGLQPTGSLRVRRD